MQRIKKAYAENGDLKIIPDTPPLDGSENWEQGRGAYYELDNDPNTGDPLALDIDRKQDNYFKNVISKNIKHWQENAYPIWFNDIEYPKNAIVKYTDGNIYVSKVANNTALPTNATNWTIYDPSSSDGQFVKLTGNQTIDGVKTFSSNIVGNITGNAGTATKLATARNIALTGGVTGNGNFDGTGNLSIATTIAGNAPTATKLATARTINGVAFDGSKNITVSDSTAVKLSGDQTVAGIKTFSSSPIVPTPTSNTQVANKAYVDTVLPTWTANDSRAKTALNASGNAPIYACRAWVNFNGTGTVAIRASGNVSSITDNGVGDYKVNFTTAIIDNNYSVSGFSGSNRVLTLHASLPNVSFVRVNNRAGDTAEITDSGSEFTSISIFR